MARCTLPLEVWSGLTSDTNAFAHNVIWKIRYPRLLDGLLVGAALAVSGNLLQGVTRNPLGDPTILLLARHGATAFSLERRFSGSGGRDVPLAPLGEEQARALAAEVVRRRSVDVVVASPLLRAQQTARIVAAELGLAVHTVEGLAECSFGEWDGHTFADVQRDWPLLLDEWLASPDVAPPGGESFAACHARVDAARRAVIAEHGGRKVLVVSHVTPIKLMVTQALDCGLHGLFRMELAPCSLSTVAWFPDGNASMFSFAESTHLDAVAAPAGT